MLVPITYRLEVPSGKILGEAIDDEELAKIRAHALLDDDPELHEVYVVDETTNEYLWRATHVPDRHFNTIVAVIGADEKIR